MNKARRKEMEKAIGFMEGAKAILETRLRVRRRRSTTCRKVSRMESGPSKSRPTPRGTEAMDEYVNNLSEVEGG